MGLLIAVLMLGAGDAAASAEGREPEPQLKRFEFVQVEMAVDVKIVLYASDASTANLASKSAYDKIRYLNSVLSDYDPQSEVRRLCAATPEKGGVAVSEDLWRVLSHAQDLSRRSAGAFDVTIGPVVRHWRRARRRKQLPTPERMAPDRKLVGYRYVRLNPKRRSVELEKSGMRIDLGGIAKGYAADAALKALNEHGVTSALIDAGGDLVLGDPPPGKDGWRIGVAPLKPDGPPSRYLTLANVGVATSGDAWQHVEIDGKRYSHIIDPRTGIGITDRSSVTVIAPTGMAADALASAVSVLGPKKGLELIKATPKTRAIIVRSPDGDKVEVHKSSDWTEEDD